MTTVRETQTLETPRADQTRFCPYHGAAILLADCPIVATNYEFNARNGANYEDPRQTNASSAANSTGNVSSRLEDSDGPPEADSKPSFAATQEPRQRPHIQIRADVDVQVGKMVRSKVDGRQRLVVAKSPHYVPRRLRSAPELEAPALLASEYGGAVVARARLSHLLAPAASDNRLPRHIPRGVGRAQGSSKTSTALAIIEEAGQTRPRRSESATSQRLRRPPLTCSRSTNRSLSSSAKTKNSNARRRTRFTRPSSS